MPTPAHKTYLLYIEGVNFDAFIFDTNDLSTVRGSGLALLEAVEAIEAFLEEKKCVPKAINKGASTGLFEIQTDDPTSLREAVLDFLAENTIYRYATFMVEIIDAPEASAYREVIECLLARKNWHQAQSGSLTFPPKSETEGLTKPACGLNGLLPALAESGHQTPNRGGDKNSFLSESVKVRREYGRTKKQLFYKHLTELNKLPDFADNFETIAAPDQTEALAGKLAVFYADGNAFGKAGIDICKSKAHQALWDHFLRTKRTAFLTKILTTIHKDRQWLINEQHDKKALRFETLLWGGDEFMFVMPARFGWWFAQQFFAHFEGMNARDADFKENPFVDSENPAPKLPDRRLTHTGALVFCHHHSPINRIKNLLQEGMADFGKAAPGGRNRDQLLYTVLESFDHLGEDYEAALTTRYGIQIDPTSSILTAPSSDKTLHDTLAAIAELIQHLHTPESGFARSQLRRLMETLLASGERNKAWLGEGQDSQHAFRNATADTRSKLAEAIGSINQTDPPTPGTHFSDPLAAWIHLEELWDYALS